MPVVEVIPIFLSMSMSTKKGCKAVHFSEEPKNVFDAGVIGWYWGEGVGLF